MKYAVISGEYEYSNELKKFGLSLLKTELNPNLQRSVAYHADMNCAKIGDMIYVAKEQTEIIAKLDELELKYEIISELCPDYPFDVYLNCAICGKNAVINPNTVSKGILSQLESDGYDIYCVKQGYSGCSTLFVNENTVITADDGIYNALHNFFDVLKISDRDINLPGFDHGFIGGSAKMINKSTMLFFGDIYSISDGEKIVRFLNNHNIKSVSLSGKLTDIGGMIIL